MPNHCNNCLTIEGDYTELEKFREFAKTEDNVLDHEKFIPYPQKFKDMDKEDENNSFNIKNEEDRINGMDGHKWAIHNWGTKWGIYDASDDQEEKLEEGHDLCYNFDTAWSPPFPIIEKMSEMFPKLDFKLFYEESGSDFEGNYDCKKGDVILNEQGKFKNTCEECGVKNKEVGYDDNDETILCKVCRMSDLQKIVHEKIGDVKE